RLDSCLVCHQLADPRPVGASARNPFGTRFEQVATHGANPSGALLSIQSLDSDGDGVSNLAEIQAQTFPGNALDYPPPPPVQIFDPPFGATLGMAQTVILNASVGNNAIVNRVDF